MEDALRNSIHGSHVVKEKNKKKGESSPPESSGEDQNIVLKVGKGKRKEREDDKSKSSSPQQKDFTINKGAGMVKRERSPPENSMASSSTHKEQDDQLASAKAEMRDVMEENHRLRTHLDRLMKDYRNLQNQLHDVVQKEQTEISSSTVNTTHHESEEEADQLVSLSLGRTSSDMKKEELSKFFSKNKAEEENKGGLTLGLDCKFGKNTTPTESSPINLSPENSLEEAAKEENGDTWPPNKVLKTMRNNGENDDVSLQNPTKRARVSVRVRCDAPTMNDGCQWRKYGQKIAKGNPCPRAYYRCTVAPSCPVRKQVQRCAEDMSILITTYEGTHNHTLPLAATAMASTTSAAACMLLSGSSTSSDHQNPQSSTTNTATTSANINGLNFYLSDSSKPKPFYFPNSSISSAPNALPTITLDLTSSSSSTSLSHLNKMSSYNFPPRYNNSSTNLNFSSLESNPLPISWSNGVLNYANQAYNKNQNIGSLNFSSRPSTPTQESNIFQSYLQKSIMNNNPTSTQTSLVQQDTIAAATKAITSDPNFQSALAAALTSIMGNPTTNKSEPFPILSSLPSSSNNPNNCSSSFLNKPTTTNSSSANTQPGNNNLVFFTQPNSSSLPFSASTKGKSTSSSENKFD